MHELCKLRGRAVLPIAVFKCYRSQPFEGQCWSLNILYQAALKSRDGSRTYKKKWFDSFPLPIQLPSSITLQNGGTGQSVSRPRRTEAIVGQRSSLGHRAWFDGESAARSHSPNSQAGERDHHLHQAFLSPGSLGAVSHLPHHGHCPWGLRSRSLAMPRVSGGVLVKSLPSHLVRRPADRKRSKCLERNGGVHLKRAS
jgi:hypothetical protein